MGEISEASQIVAEVVFERFLDWVSSQPDVEVLQAALQLVSAALDNQPVDRQAAREAVVMLAGVAQEGPFAEVMVETFRRMIV